MFMQQLLNGIAHLHERDFHHRDLKPANLLIDHNQVLNIADFGCAKTFDFPVNTTSSEVCRTMRMWKPLLKLLNVHEGSHAVVSCTGVTVGVHLVHFLG
jgi:serine/threonine protein kinase